MYLMVLFVADPVDDEDMKDLREGLTQQGSDKTNCIL